MSLVETRTWTVYCKRQFVNQCLDTRVVDSDVDDVGSTVQAEKLLRSEGWTLHDGEGDGTCPVCLEVWEGNVILESRGSIKATPDGGGSRADKPLVGEKLPDGIVVQTADE